MSREYRKAFDEAVAVMATSPTYQENYMFYAHLLSRVSVRFTETLPAPAGVRFNVDHYEMFVNPNIFNEYPIVQRLGVIKHELMHILNGHVKLEEVNTRERKPWNFATDCAINQLIPREHLPSGGIYPDVLERILNVRVPEKLSGWEYYDIIMQNKPDDTGGSGDGEGDGSEGSGGSGASHEMWEESVGSEDFRKAITEKMINDAREDTQRARGNVPVEVSEWLEIHSTESQINWLRVLAGVVGNKRVGKRPTIKRNDRRFPHREDLRGKTKDRKFDLLVIPDVSGSMCDIALTETLGEIAHLCRQHKVEATMIQVDTQPQKPEKINKNVKNFNRKGHGGTFLTPAIQMARDHNVSFNAVVILTDGGLGYDDVSYFGTLGVPVIWLIESTGIAMPGMDDGLMRSFKLEPRK